MKKLLFAVLAITLTAISLSTPGPVLAHPQDAPATQDKQDKQDKSDKPGNQDKRINGKWHFVFNTEGGDRDFEAEFSVDPEGKVTGTWNKTPAVGTYKDGHLQMAFDTFSDEANETAQLQLDGKIDETNTLTGSWAFSTYDGTFKATQPKP